MKRIIIFSLWAFFFLWVYLAAGQIVPNRYIVELTGDSVAALLSRSSKQPRSSSEAEVSAHRETVRLQQAEVQRAVEAMRGEVVASMDTTINAISVKIPDTQAPQLYNIPGVRRVMPVFQMHPNLDHALGIHHVYDAWQRIGGMEVAGLGIKIGIIDSGIDQTHPGFQDPSLPIPDGFPRANQMADLAFTNNKVIVARDYARLYPATGNSTPRDLFGHGTAVAMTAAGVSHITPLGMISGVAPKAWLGSYKNSLPGASGNSFNDVSMKAFDDAVADGMDVINMSFGGVSPRPVDDLFAEVIDAAVRMGVVVTISAGNAGSTPFTVGSPGSALDAITVGAIFNDRKIEGNVTLPDGTAYRALAGDNSLLSDSITGALTDVAKFDPSGLACQALPAASLRGNIALIMRGTCNFSVKLNNALMAGAIAAIVYTTAASPDPIVMAQAGVSIPAVMVSNADGVDLKQRAGADPSLKATVSFHNVIVPEDPNNLTNFSSRGPNPDEAIKPDLVAVGEDVFTAVPVAGSTLGANYAVVGGTSFSAPLTAGAAAVLKGARQGLSAYAYRSLLINSASPLMVNGADTPLGVQLGGAGILNLDAAVQTTVAAYPTSLNYRVGNGVINSSRILTLSNLGTAPDTYQISVVPFVLGVAPALAMRSMRVDGRKSGSVAVQFSAMALAPGEYQGFLVVQGQQPGSTIRVPYWYAVPSDIAKFVNVLGSAPSAPVRSALAGAILVQVLDASGIPMGNITPTVTVVSGGGRVLNVSSDDLILPGSYLVDVLLGPNPGDNVFRIQVGEITKDVTIQGLQP